MTLEDRIQEVMDLIEMSFDSDVALAPDSTMKSIGIDSLDAVELLLVLEERWPGVVLDDFFPTVETTVRDIASEVEKRIVA